jgi:hypothetical protein
MMLRRIGPGLPSAQAQPQIVVGIIGPVVYNHNNSLKKQSHRSTLAACGMMMQYPSFPLSPHSAMH